MRALGTDGAMHCFNPFVTIESRNTLNQRLSRKSNRQLRKLGSRQTKHMHSGTCHEEAWPKTKTPGPPKPNLNSQEEKPIASTYQTRLNTSRGIPLGISVDSIRDELRYSLIFFNVLLCSSPHAMNFKFFIHL